MVRPFFYFLHSVRLVTRCSYGRLPPILSIMSATREMTTLSQEELVTLVITLTQQIEELRQEMEELRRGVQPSAAPFSKDQRKKNPKKPGRKKGEGPFQQRAAPELESITAPVVEVPLASEIVACPQCGGE